MESAFVIIFAMKYNYGTYPKNLYFHIGNIDIILYFL